MSTKYTFISQTDEKTVTTEFTCKEETWGPPLQEFFNFLKGTGFLFKIEEELVVFNTTTEEVRDGITF